MNGLRRRELLTLLAGLGVVGITRPAIGAAAWPARSSGPGSPARRPPDTSYDLRGLLPRNESARVLGAEYLRRVPGERSESLLVERLALSPSDGLSTTRDRLAESHRRDLRGGSVFTLHGFTFSRTELRLCALLHLLGPQ